MYFMAYPKNHGDFGEFGDEVLKNKLPQAFGMKNIWLYVLKLGEFGELGGYTAMGKLGRLVVCSPLPHVLW